MTTFNISSDTYFDDIVGLTGGSDVININNNATMTIRTDTRVHANAPSGNVGMLGNINVTHGKLVYDSTNVRWMAFNNGSGTVPAVGTIITQGDVSGYLIGVWAAVNVAPTGAGSTMPTSGFIKLMWVTGGQFEIGGLTGVTASCASPDVQGWIEVSALALVNFGISYGSSHDIKGGRFYLDNTTGTVAQVFKVPTFGSTGMPIPGMWVEKEPNSMNRDEDYEWWPATSSNYTNVFLGVPTPDERHKILYNTGTTLQMGIAPTTQAFSSYAAVTAVSSTYSSSPAYLYTQHYIWENDVLTVWCTKPHYLKTGMSAGLNFTSGGAISNSGSYIVTVIDAKRFTIAMPGSGDKGSVNVGALIYLTVSSHAFRKNDTIVFINTDSSTLPSGNYVITGTSSTIMVINYPHLSAISGTGTIGGLVTVTFSAVHNIQQVGTMVQLTFSSGTGVNGTYYVTNVVSTTKININMPITTVTTGTGYITRSIGYVAEAGLRTWIPSTITTNSALVTSTTPSSPSTSYAITGQTHWTPYGDLNFDHTFFCGHLLLLNNANSITMKHCSYIDYMGINYCNTPFDLSYIGIGGRLSGYGNVPISIQYCSPGGSIRNSVFVHMGQSIGYMIYASYTNNLTIDSCKTIYGYYNTYPAINFLCVNSATISNCHFNPGYMHINGCTDINIHDIDVAYYINGLRTDSTYGAFSIYNSSGVTVSGITSNSNSMLLGSERPSLAYIRATNLCNAIFTDIGSKDSPVCSEGTIFSDTSAVPYLYFSLGGNSNVVIQRVYTDGGFSSALLKPSPTDINIKCESIYSSIYTSYGTIDATLRGQAPLYAPSQNTIIRLVEAGDPPVFSYPCIGGYMFSDELVGDSSGYLQISMNTISSTCKETFTKDAGHPYITGNGSLAMNNVGDSVTITDGIYRLGYTGFDKYNVTMVSGILSNYDMLYKIDNNDGNGFGDYSNLCINRTPVGYDTNTITFSDATGVVIGDYVYGDNVGFQAVVTDINSNVVTLSENNTGEISGNVSFNHIPNESVSSTNGFKIKLKITTINNNDDYMSNILIPMVTNTAERYTVYPVVTSSGVEVIEGESELSIPYISIDSIIPGSEFRAYTGTTTLYSTSVASDNINFSTQFVGDVKLELRKGATAPFYKPWSCDITTASGTITKISAQQILD